jgi:hypothetical protein
MVNSHLALVKHIIHDLAEALHVELQLAGTCCCVALQAMQLLLLPLQMLTHSCYATATFCKSAAGTWLPVLAQQKFWQC